MHLSAEPSPLHACMTHIPMYMYSMAHCAACSVSGILNYIPCTWTCSSLFRVSAWSRSRGKAPGYVTIQTESFYDSLTINCELCTWEPLPVYIVTALADNWPARHRIVINSCTPLHHWAGLNMTTIPSCPVYHECVLSVRRPLPFSIGGLRRTDGQKSPNDCSNPSAYV